MSPVPRLLTLALFALVAEAALARNGDSWIPGRLSVRFKSLPDLQLGTNGPELGVPELDRINRDLAGLHRALPLYKHLGRMYQPDLRLNYLLEFDPGLDMERVAALYTATGLVEYAEPDYLLPVRRTSNDPDQGLQWYLDTIQAREAWDSLPPTPDFPGMVIAVVDTGVDWDHPDLRPVIWCNPEEDLDGDGLMPDDGLPGEAEERNGVDDGGNGYIDDFYGWSWITGNDPMDLMGHGTACAGIAASATDNAIGVASAAWGSRVMCLQVGYQGSDGNGYVIQSAAANAVVYAIENGARLVTLGFGGSQTVRTPCTVAFNSGLLCFHAAGNDGSEQSDALDQATGMISVAASDSSDCLADFSNRGNWVGLTAPGVGIYNTTPGAGYSVLSGTSMACAVAAGVAALVWNTNPEQDNLQVRERLFATADDLSAQPCNEDIQGLLGHGRVNAYRAVHDIRETSIGHAPGTLPAGIALSPAWPNPFNPSTRLELSLDRAASVELAVYDLRGALVSRLLDGPLAAGRHQVVFGGSGLASGIYFASLSVDGQPVAVRKMVLAR